MDFFEHLCTFMSREEATNLINSLDNEEIHCFMLNSLKVANISNIFPENNSFLSHKHINNAYIYDKSSHELGKNILFEAGAFYIQEPAAMMAVEQLGINENDYVLDMCAAPGGKSFNALIKLNNTGLLVCNDNHDIRSKILSSNIEKYGFGNCIVLNDDSKRYRKYFNNFFDKIILDAPCSGSAMFRKNDLAKQDWSLDKVYKCQEMQKSLIEDAYLMLKPGGRLLYSTCSFSIQENEEVIIDFLNKHSDIEILNIDLNKQYNNSIGINGGLRLYPDKFDGEGQVIFILSKSSSSDVLTTKYKEMKSSRLPSEAMSFLNNIGLRPNREDIIQIRDNYYYANFFKIDLAGLNVKRYGLELGSFNKDRFEPSHSLAMCNKISKDLFLSLSYNEAIDFLKGLPLSKEGSGGYKIVSYNNLALGWCKHVNNTLKNHYPKGLRIKF